MIFVGVEVLMVYICYFILGLYVVVNVCIVVGGFLYNLRCLGYFLINMLYEF